MNAQRGCHPPKGRQAGDRGDQASAGTKVGTGDTHRMGRSRAHREVVGDGGVPKLARIRLAYLTGATRGEFCSSQVLSGAYQACAPSSKERDLSVAPSSIRCAPVRKVRSAHPGRRRVADRHHSASVTRLLAPAMQEMPMKDDVLTSLVWASGFGSLFTP